MEDKKTFASGMSLFFGLQPRSLPPPMRDADAAVVAAAPTTDTSDLPAPFELAHLSDDRLGTPKRGTFVSKPRKGERVRAGGRVSVKRRKPPPGCER